MNAAAPAGEARVEAARALAAVLDQSASLDSALPLADARLSDPRDRALLRAIVYASLRGTYRYQALLGQLLAKPLRAREREIHALLLTGLAQLDGGIAPPYAAVSGTVAAARSLGFPHLSGLVNAVLRRYQGEREALHAALPDSDELRFNHPAWLIQALRRDWPQDWRTILEANNAEAPLWLRVNRLRGNRDDYAKDLAAAGNPAQVEVLLPDALRVEAGGEITALPGFELGAVSVQDGAAQLAAELLDLRPGLRLLDACAAPGGKTAHALEREPALTDVWALDLREERVAKIHSTLRRLGLAASLRVADATRPQTWWDGRVFDRILIDAPCSGTGVIRRRPDIRLLRREGDIAVQIEVQARLLDALWPLLAVGGRLVYATCSVLPDENERQIAAFLTRTPDARALDAVPVGFGRAAGAGRQNLPGVGGMDGFFYAVLARAG